MSAKFREILQTSQRTFANIPRVILQCEGVAERKAQSRSPFSWETSSMTRPRRPRGASVQSPLETYLREINETALLSADEEKMLARRIEEGDSEARDRM